MKKASIIAVTSALLCISGCSEIKQDKPSPIDVVEISGATKSVIVERTNDFGVRLFHSYSSNNSSNIIISPLSCAYATSMLSLGANGETYDEIVNTLGLTGKDKQALGAFYKSISEDLIQADDAVSFETANSIWLGENITIKPSYSENALYYYNAQAHNVDFNSPATVKIINGWISEKTQGLIQNMISNTDGWIVALINALYFKSAWSETMSAGCMSFNTVDGKTIKESAVISDKFSLYEGSEGQYVSMDFGGEGNFIFELMIPKDNISTASEITDKLSDYRKNAQPVNDGSEFIMPYLDIELMTDLASTLKSMGIKKAFTAKAEFEDFANYRFAISKILQKSRIILNVKGCESASTTVIVGETANLPGEKNRIIAADHPFIFSIYEKTSGAILFIGQKVK